MSLQCLYLNRNSREVLNATQSLNPDKDVLENPLYACLLSFKHYERLPAEGLEFTVEK